jgi:hypothetical protein
LWSILTSRPISKARKLAGQRPVSGSMLCTRLIQGRSRRARAPHVTLWRDLKSASRRSSCMARRRDRQLRHSSTIYRRKFTNRLISRPRRTKQRLRGCLRANRAHALDLLLFANFRVGSRNHRRSEKHAGSSPGIEGTSRSKMLECAFSDVHQIMPLLR